VTLPLTDTDIGYYGFCVYSVYSIMGNNTSVADHVTNLSYHSSSIWLARSLNKVLSDCNVINSNQRCHL